MEQPSDRAGAAGVREQAGRLSTGIQGLDEVLLGGLLPRRAYLVRGGPGTGKTILGLHYLMAGAAAGERCLFVSLGEDEEHIRKNAASLGFELEGVDFVDLTPTSEFFTEVQTYDIFSPAEVERQPVTQHIIEEVTRVRPQRVFADAMTQFRYLAPDPFQFRRQVLSFLRFLIEREVTVVYTSEVSESAPDDDLQFIADGVINLGYQAGARNLSISKYRGSDYRGGSHALTIGPAGMQVFPRLVPEAHRREFPAEVIASGVPELDEMLHGGLPRGTITLISGPTGVGKTTVALQFMKEAAGRGERSVAYLFDEGSGTLVKRSEGINIPIASMVEQGTLSVTAVEALQYTPEEFAAMVREEVEQRGARIVMLDSISGYSLSLRGEELVMHLHALGRYLKNMGVTVLLVSEVANITGDFRVSEVGISYLADNVVFLRYFEMAGMVHKAIGVLKKRTSDFEKSLRELEITRFGLKVGRPLTELHGVLLGTPEVVGEARESRR